MFQGYRWRAKAQSSVSSGPDLLSINPDSALALVVMPYFQGGRRADHRGWGWAILEKGLGGSKASSPFLFETEPGDAGIRAQPGGILPHYVPPLFSRLPWRRRARRTSLDGASGSGASAGVCGDAYALR